MTNTPDTPAQLSDLIRSVEARITPLQHERQVRDPAMLATLQLRNTVQNVPADVSLSRHRAPP